MGEHAPLSTHPEIDMMRGEMNPRKHQTVINHALFPPTPETTPIRYP